MFKKGLKEGFTLIELLVVIAIIGIMSGVILTSLGTARSKGLDAAIKGDLDSIRGEAEVYFDNNSQSYANMCANDPVVVKALTAAKAIAGSGTSATPCTSSATAWVTEIQLRSATGTTSFWCVDSAGNALMTAGTPVSGLCQ